MNDELYGGAYMPEVLLPTLDKLESEFTSALDDPAFTEEFDRLLREFCGRPTPLTYAENMTREFGGAKCYLKNEGLNHTGAHKITHCVGQALLAKHRLGKNTIIAETGAGQHGLATATIAAKLGLKCKIFMGRKDMLRQRPNVFWMQRLGAEVVEVKVGSETLKDAVNEALKYWMANLQDTHYIIGSVLGPRLYPLMNRTFQSVVGREVRVQLQAAAGQLPSLIVACVGGGSNAMGIFHEFLGEKDVSLAAVEAGGRGNLLGDHAAKAGTGILGIAQGYKSLFLQTDTGQIAPTHSVSAGLDYPGLGPELAGLRDAGRVQFHTATDLEALTAVEYLARAEGIVPALESAHAVAFAMRVLSTLPRDESIVVNISGRGDKDLFILARALKDRSFKEFLKREYEEYGENMNRLDNLVSKRDGRTPLMTHLIAGYPSLDASLEVARAMVRAGASIIEVQIPFSDPLADGEEIVIASHEALGRQPSLGVTDVLRLIRTLSDETDTPVVLMSYLNPLFRYGLPRLVEHAKEAGVMGIIIPDLPVDTKEGLEFIGAAAVHGVRAIIVVSPPASVADAQEQYLRETAMERRLQTITTVSIT